MWFAPSNFAQASGCSQKAFMPDCDIADSLPALWVTSSGTPTLRQPSWHGWKRRPWSRLLYGPGISRMSDGSSGMERWIASLRGFHASLTVWPEVEKEPMTPAGSGQQLQSAFASFDRGSSCWRTFPGFDLLGECPPYSQTWPRSGSVSNGTASERPTWVPATSESACSSWPTPDTGHERSNRSPSPGAVDRPTIALAASKWTTPQAHDITERGSGQQPTSKAGNACLARDARTWPTPAGRDAKGENSEIHATLTGGGRKHMDQLPNFVAYSPQVQAIRDGQTSSEADQTSPRRRLNPNFAEWLMGWPPGWSIADQTACDASETALWRCRLQSQLCILVGGSD